jgi:peptidoglycan/LPS O-acetylase OafA/YrhL
MNPMSFGLLCTLPFTLVFFLRLGRLRFRTDARVRRQFLVKAVTFLALSFMVTALLYATRGSQPLPVFWLLLVVISAAALLLGLLKGA